MDASSSSKNIYLNKILQKNLGIKKVTIEQTIFQKNISNFQSNIQSILANEETRQKAKNYVLSIRNKANSPFNISNKNIKGNNLSKTNYDGFYDKKNKKNNYGDNYELKKEVIYKSKIPYPEYDNSNSYIKIKEHNTPDKVIKVNKIINKYYDEIPTYSPIEGNIYYRSNLGISKNSSRGNLIPNNINNNMNMKNNIKIPTNNKTNYPLATNRQNYYKKNHYSNISQNYNQVYNDNNEFEEGYIINYDNNQNETNSISDREIVLDNNELYQSPHALSRRNNDYNDYNDQNYANINDYNNYISGSKKKKKIVINTNNNTQNNSNIYSHSKKSLKQKAYTNVDFSYSESKKNDDNININEIREFNNNILKIEKKRFRIKAEKNKNIDYNSDIMQVIRNKFLENIKAVSTNELSIKEK